MGAKVEFLSLNNSMKTKILKINRNRVIQEHITMMNNVLAGSGVIAYPTDTFYGLGCDSRSQDAVRKIYHLKKRLSAKPSPVLVADLDMVKRLASELPPSFMILAARFWPGPLTLVLRVREDFPPEILGPNHSLAMRLPDISWIRDLARGLGAPLVATSANISGEKEIARPEEVIAVFQGKVDLIIEGGPTPGGKPSTVVDLTSGGLKILREGRIPEQLILDAVNLA